MFRAQLTFKGCQVSVTPPFVPRKNSEGPIYRSWRAIIPSLPTRGLTFFLLHCSKHLSDSITRSGKDSSDLLKPIRDVGSQWRIADAQRRCGRRQWHSPAFNVIAHEGHGPDRVQRQPNTAVWTSRRCRVVCPGRIPPTRWLP